VEISLNIEAEVSVELSFAWLSLPVFAVDEIELLVDLSMLVPNNKVSVLGINSA
jgi:hypothetical protein